MTSVDPPFRVLVEQALPHGRLVAVSLPSGASDAHLLDALAEGRRTLPAEEDALAAALAVPRRVSFVGGRLALRAALSSVSPETRSSPVLRTPRGAPLLPAGVLGSVSHKRRVAMALAAVPSGDVGTIGVDVEEVPDERELTRPDLASRILTPLERHGLAPLAARDPLAYREAVRLRFALKEAVYKAIDPHVQRYVRFQEVELFPESEGEAEVRLLLPEFAVRRITVRAWWTRLAGHLVATAAGSPME